jgi:hypothetical protein
MRWAWNVAGMGESGGEYRVFVRRNIRERDHLGDQTLVGI